MERLFSIGQRDGYLQLRANAERKPRRSPWKPLFSWSAIRSEAAVRAPRLNRLILTKQRVLRARFSSNYKLKLSCVSSCRWVERQDADFRENPHGEDHNPRGGYSVMEGRGVQWPQLTRVLLTLQQNKCDKPTLDSVIEHLILSLYVFNSRKVDAMFCPTSVS